MESDATQSTLFYDAWKWGDKHRKQIAWGAVVVLVVALAITAVILQKNAKRDEANEALSKLTTHTGNAPAVTPENLLKVYSDYPGTDAGSRALLLAATALFDSGKYQEAEAQFQKFVQSYGDSEFVGQAMLGVAASLDAQGKTNDAIAAYQRVIQRRPNDNVVPQAKFALGRLYEAQGKWDEARNQFEDTYRTAQYTSVGSEAGIRSSEIEAKHPAAVSTNKPAGTLPAGTTIAH